MCGLSGGNGYKVVKKSCSEQGYECDISSSAPKSGIGIRILGALMTMGMGFKTKCTDKAAAPADGILHAAARIANAQVRIAGAMRCCELQASLHWRTRVPFVGCATDTGGPCLRMYSSHSYVHGSGLTSMFIRAFHPLPHVHACTHRYLSHAFSLSTFPSHLNVYRYVTR